MKNILLIPFLFMSFVSQSQNPNIKRTWHWYFGNHAGIDFSSGTAMADTNGALVTSEGCASISDTDGNLQFYSDGRTVWNRNHQVMPHGTSILGGANGSSTQQALIIPKPLSPNLYYLFTTDEAENLGANGMRYTVIDMNLDGGNGDVDTNQKNILLFSPCTEKLAAVNHCNDTSVWVMGHEVNNNHFRAYLVTANGIAFNPVVSAIGFPNMSNALGQINGPIKFSSDGTKLCQVTDTSAKRVELFQFDDYSGYLSNNITLDTTIAFCYAISFSNDNSKLYTGRTSSYLYQYDVTTYNQGIILGSKTIVDSITNNGYRYLQNSPDGKIVLLLNGNFPLASSINLPNLTGSASNVDTNNIDLLNHQSRAGLPGFNESYFKTNNTPGCATGISETNTDQIEIQPNLARDWIVVRGNSLKEIRIFDLSGRMIFHSYPFTASPSILIDVASFPRGVYIISVRVNHTLANKTIILQ